LTNTIWSQKLSDKFQINLTPELQAWFDQEIWKESAYIRFGEPVDPEHLCIADSGIIWGGLMLPDSIPVLGNGFGDQICLRFDELGNVNEIICWNHECGFWLPYGKTLPQSILFDVFLCYLESPSEKIDDIIESPLFQWATHYIPFSLDELVRYAEVIKTCNHWHILLGSGLKEESLCKLIAETCLKTVLIQNCNKIGGQTIAKKIRVNWENVTSWLYEPNLIPEKKRKKLAKIFKVSQEELLSQDWNTAVKFSKRVIETRNDLGWAYAVIGRNAERNDQIPLAIEMYFKGLSCSVTTYDFTSQWHNPTLQTMKFCGQRLIALKSLLPIEITQDKYYQAVIDSDFYSIYEYWREKAESYEENGDYPNAYRSWFKAGWDEFVFDNMNVVLQGLKRTAKMAGFNALYQIANHHLNSLELKVWN